MQTLRTMSLIVTIASWVSLISCGGDDGGSPSNSIIGEWEFHDATGTAILNFPGAMNSVNQIKLINTGVTVIYRSDSTFTANNPNVAGGPENGKFKISGNNITHYDYSSGAFFWDGPIEVNGNQFTARVTEDQIVQNLIAGGMSEEDAEDFYTTYDVTYLFKRK